MRNLIYYIVAEILSTVLPKRLATFVEDKNGSEFIGWSYEYPRWKVWVGILTTFVGIAQS